MNESKRSFFRLRRLFAFGLGMTLLTLIITALGYFQNMERQAKLQEAATRMAGLKNQILHLDEILTQSARLAALTGDLKWIDRYQSFEPELGKMIEEAIQLSPDSFKGDAANKTNEANVKLVEAENNAFRLIKKGEVERAKNVLFGKEYLEQKRIYAYGMALFDENLARFVSEIELEVKFLGNLYFGIVVGCFFILFGIWTYVGYRSVRIQKDYFRLSEVQLKQQHDLAMLGELSGSLAHEIANPLTVALNRVRLMKKVLHKNGPSEKISLLQERLQSDLDRMTNVLKGVRAFSRREESQDKKDYVLKEIVDQAVIYAEPRLKKRGVKNVEVNVPDLQHVHCQEIQIQQVLVNLLHNAADAITKLDQRWIRIESNETEENVIISVTDSGHGIPRGIAEKMFETQFTTKNRGQGTGLGLSLSRRIVEDHGGYLELDSASQNTRFNVVIAKPLPKESSLKRAA